jgi:hypothetical protein
LSCIIIAVAVRELQISVTPKRRLHFGILPSMATSDDSDDVLRQTYNHSTYFQQLHSTVLQKSINNEHDTEFLSCLAPSVLRLVDVSSTCSLIEQSLINPGGVIDWRALDTCFRDTDDPVRLIKSLAVAAGAAHSGRDSSSDSTRRAQLFSGLPFGAALPQAYSDVLHGGEGQL